MTREQIAKIWRIDEFKASAPDGIIRTYKAHVITWPLAVMPQGGIGVDPGLRFGLSFIEAEDVVHTLSMYIDRTDVSSAELMKIMENVAIMVPESISKKTPVVVEGPAHNARYGQANLGAVRGALLLGFHNAGYDHVVQVPPLTVRKRVYGDGRTQPKEFWQRLKEEDKVNKDQLDSMSMAISAGI